MKENGRLSKRSYQALGERMEEAMVVAGVELTPEQYAEEVENSV